MKEEEEKIKFEIEKIKFEIESNTNLVSVLLVGIFLGISLSLLAITDNIWAKIGILLTILIVFILTLTVYHIFTTKKYKKINQLYNKLLK